MTQLDSLGVPRAAWSAFVTSGDATRALLAERAPGPAWAIGPDRDWPLYEDLGLDFAGPDEAAFISCTGPVDDEVETPEDYRDRLLACARRGLEMICANPDRVVQRGDRLIYCGGALADLYAALDGPVLMAGKPYAPIYHLAVAEASALLGRPVDRARILCVGDGVADRRRAAPPTRGWTACSSPPASMATRRWTPPAGSIPPAPPPSWPAKAASPASSPPT